MEKLILSVTANGGNIMIGRREDVIERLNGIIISVGCSKNRSEKYLDTLIQTHAKINRLIGSPFVKIRINPLGEINVIDIKYIEDLATEINLTLSEI